MWSDVDSACGLKENTEEINSESNVFLYNKITAH